MKNIKEKYAYLMITMSMLILLSACAKTPESVIKDGMVVAGEDVGGSAQGGNVQGGNTETDDTVEKQNERILAACSGEKIEWSLTNNEGKEIIVDAVVNTDKVTRVSRYEYVLREVTEDMRQRLFAAIYGDRASEVVYDERNDVWELPISSKVGDYWVYEISYHNGGTTVPGEQIVVMAYEHPNLYPFIDNRLRTVSDSRVEIPPEEAVRECREAILAVTEEDDYSVNYIHAYGTDDRRPYYKIVFVHMLDGMPVTAYNDLYFLYDDDGFEKVSGSFYSVKETGPEQAIIAPEYAAELLKKQASALRFAEDALVISEIGPEYLTVLSASGDADIRPVWRFRIGRDEEERQFYRDRILAIDAVNGNLIYGERGNTF